MRIIQSLPGRLAHDLTTESRHTAPSGWYMDTGEGRAVAAGSEDLAGVDLDKVLGHRFRLAVLAVAEVNASGAVDSLHRFDQVRAVCRRLEGAADV